ncbi:MAG: glycine oxidase ThiO [Solirubrobacterales bacterium]
MTARKENSYDALIVGAGVIGLACAWRAACAGARVCVLERDYPAAGATGVAAGMLAPVGEASWGEERLLSLNLDSLRRWPDFARELEADAGDEVGYAECGALHVALDRDEAEALRRRHELHRRLGLESEWLRGSECRRVEPGLATAVRSGVHARHEAAVDPRRLAGALLAALERRGVPVATGAEVVAAERDTDTWRLTTADRRDLAASIVVLASGAWSGGAGWLPAEVRVPVRPVKGEILTLRGISQQPVCEGIVAGERVYVVPRGDGRLIVGATVEEAGFDTTVTAGGVLELLREAYRLLPEIAELELAETAAGVRPGTPDNAPLIGLGAAGLIVATGHFRNGVLQAPVTADSVVALLEGKEPPHDLDPFSPLRFASEPAVAEAVR